MNKTKSLLKKLVTLVLGVLGIGTITSCYGMPPNGGENEFTGTVYASWIDEESGEPLREPLKHVMVSLRTLDRDMNCLLDIDFTDEEGHYFIFTFSENENAELIFEPDNIDKNIQKYGGYLETKRIPVKLEYREYEFNSETINVDLECINESSENNSSSGN